MRVAIVRANSTVGRTATESLIANLRFNGKSVVENRDSFRDIPYPEPAPSLESYEPAVREVVQMRPHAIIMLAEQMTEELIVPIEREWPPNERSRPYYIALNTFEEEKLFRFLGKDSERRKRFLSFTPAYATPANVGFTARYNEAFTPKVALASSPAAPYDSLYMIAYAAMAAGEQPLTGRTLARSVARLLPPGSPVDVGPSGISSVMSLFRSGQNVDLQGAYAPLDFDPLTGESDANFSILCIGVDKSGRATESVDSGLTYEGRARSLVGTYDCK